MARIAGEFFSKIFGKNKRNKAPIFDGTTRIPIFDGTNYESWNEEMRDRFLPMDLWRTVQDGYNDEPSEQEKQKDAEALSNIRQGVSNRIFPEIRNATTAKQAWDILSRFSNENATLRIDLRQAAANHLVVATLIATVAFTAGFTMPGGYNGNDGPNQGMAILTRKAAFQAFMVTDTIAMSCSILAVFTHFDAAITDDLDKVQKQVIDAAVFIVDAAVAMVLAFVTGTYVVLAHSSGLAISVCVIGCLPLPLLCRTNIFTKVLIDSHVSMIGSFFGSEPTGRIPIFDGTNYKSWNVEMRDRFSSMDLWRTVQNGYNDEPSEEESQKDAAALSHIQQGVSNRIFPEIQNARTAKQAWDILFGFNTENAILRIDLRQTAAHHLIVATLIATVAFTAGFTMPGGYNGNDGPNQGMAILTRKAVFQAFMVTDTIAMSFSILAVFTHFDAAIIDDLDKLKKQVYKAAYLTSTAAGAMVLAFVTGTYVVLAHSSGLAILVCVLGCLPLLPLLFWPCKGD